MGVIHLSDCSKLKLSKNICLKHALDQAAPKLSLYLVSGIIGEPLLDKVGRLQSEA